MKHLIGKFKSELMALSDEALVARFNREVVNRGWVSARTYFLEAIRNQFEHRAIDYIVIKNETRGFNLENRVVLRDSKLSF